MKQTLVFPILLGSALALGGCLPMMAANVVGMAIKSGQGTPQSNAVLQPTATEACSVQASQYGAVKIIDVQQASINKIIVWGTAGEGAARRSFECDFGTKITSFKLRAIKPMP